MSVADQYEIVQRLNAVLDEAEKLPGSRDVDGVYDVVALRYDQWVKRRWRRTQRAIRARGPVVTGTRKYGDKCRRCGNLHRYGAECGRLATGPGEEGE